MLMLNAHSRIKVSWVSYNSKMDVNLIQDYVNLMICQWTV
jgi:hypothetical protein